LNDLLVCKFPLYTLSDGHWTDARTLTTQLGIRNFINVFYFNTEIEQFRPFERLNWTYLNPLGLSTKYAM